jgi:hypothetical protein
MSRDAALIDRSIFVCGDHVAKTTLNRLTQSLTLILERPHVVTDPYSNIHAMSNLESE